MIKSKQNEPLNKYSVRAVPSYDHRTVYPTLPGGFPVYYSRVNGTTLQGVAR